MFRLCLKEKFAIALFKNHKIAKRKIIDNGGLLAWNEISTKTRGTPWTLTSGKKADMHIFSFCLALSFSSISSRKAITPLRCEELFGAKRNEKSLVGRKDKKKVKKNKKTEDQCGIYFVEDRSWHEFKKPIVPQVRNESE